MASTVTRAQCLLTGITTETSLAVTGHVRAVAAVIAVVLAFGLTAVLANVILIAITTTSVASSIARAFVRAHFDGAIGSLPSTVAFTCTIVAVTVSKAVVQTDSLGALETVPPMITSANASCLVTLAMVRAVVRARMPPTVLSFPAVSTTTLSGLPIADSVV